MKKNTLIILSVIIFIIIAIRILSYSEYGAPSEFGNDTETTCWVGGDPGIINCTGNINSQSFSTKSLNITISNETGYDHARPGLVADEVVISQGVQRFQ